MFGRIPSEEGTLEYHAQSRVPHGQCQFGWVDDTRDAGDRVQGIGKFSSGAQEISMEYARFILETDQDEVVVCAERFTELQIKCSFRLPFWKESFEIVAKSNIGSTPSSKGRQESDGHQNPTAPNAPYVSSV